MSTARAKVAVIGGDPVVGDALEVLLQTVGYRTRFLPESVICDLDELLADSQLLVVAPVLSAECRKTLIEMKLGQTMPLNIPVLELLPANGGQRLPVGDSLLWPCSGQELKDAIAALLLDQGRSGTM